MPDTALVPTAPPASAPLSDEGRISLAEAERRLEAAIIQLTTAPLKDIPRLTVDVQRWRVGVMVLKERAENTVNPKIYNEMSLLTRMSKNVDFDEDVDKEDAERVQSAADKLRAAGITAAGARTVVELLMNREPPHAIDDEDAESDADAPAHRD